MLRLFTTTGRLRRRTFFWSILLLYALAFACYGVPALAETRLHSAAPHWQYGALAGLALCYYLVIVQAVKRLHDIDLRGWWLLLALVPLVSIGLGAGMQFIAGTAGPNRFGPDPKQPQLSASPLV